jgi:diaminopimelate epimerase
MRFWKYHGTGNDFVMVVDLDDEHPWPADLIAAACHRRFGVGADGVIRVVRGQGGTDFFMDYANADGRVAEMCGNGIRCLGKLVYDAGLTRKTELEVGTRGGTKHLTLRVEDGAVSAVTVDMGPPELTRARIPMTGDPSSSYVDQPLDVDGRTVPATAVSMGNPHIVLFLPDGEGPGDWDVPRVGRDIELRPEFPNRTNVEFVRVEDGVARARVWERGSGETMACGTGACAVMVAASVTGRTGRTAQVVFPGGVLDLRWDEGGPVLLTGPAVRVFGGELDPAWVRANRGSQAGPTAEGYAPDPVAAAGAAR